MTKKSKNAKYWKNRAINMEEEKEKMADILADRTRQSYKRSFERLNSAIDALYSEIRDNGIENMSRTDLYNLEKYHKLRKKIAEETEGLAVEDNKNLEDLLNKISVGTYSSNLKEMGIGFDMIAEQQAKAIASQNWTGIKFSDRIWGNANDFNSRVMSDIEDMVIGGKSPDQLKKQLMKDYSTKFSEADRLIRTEASHAYNTAALESYAQAGCQEVEFLAESDCCDLCKPYSKKKFLIADAPVIPVHPNCRCTYLPVIETMS